MLDAQASIESFDGSFRKFSLGFAPPLRKTQDAPYIVPYIELIAKKSLGFASVYFFPRSARANQPLRRFCALVRSFFDRAGEVELNRPGLGYHKLWAAIAAEACDIRTVEIRTPGRPKFGFRHNSTLLKSTLSEAKDFLTSDL
jgi:hypothetical protein